MKVMNLIGLGAALSAIAAAAGASKDEMAALELASLRIGDPYGGRHVKRFRPRTASRCQRHKGYSDDAARRCRKCMPHYGKKEQARRYSPAAFASSHAAERARVLRNLQLAQKAAAE